MKDRKEKTNKQEAVPEPVNCMSRASGLWHSFGEQAKMRLPSRLA